MNCRVNPEDPFSNLNCGRGTSDGKGCNRIINCLCTDVTRMSAELSHKKLWLRVTDFNLKLDKRLRKVLKIEKPLTLDWCLHEGLHKRNKSFSLCNTMNFPPELPTGCEEPIIGLGYGRFLEQERVLGKIHQTLEPN